MEYLDNLGKKAKSAKYILQKLSTDVKNSALKSVADALIHRQEYILEANKQDIIKAEESGMHPGLVDRLRLTPDRIKGMSEGIYQVIDLEDPVFEVLETFERPNGLTLNKIRVPLGVIGIIYESRPNVTADAFALCFKTSNVVILKGGSDAISSNTAITTVIQDALEENGICRDVIQLIESTDRETTKEFMKMKQYVDVLIPRGGAGLIRTVVENSTIPVIETGTGNCHIYIDEECDMDMAVNIVLNAKTQRIGVCNACESLVIHEKQAETFLLKIQEVFKPHNVEIRGDETVTMILKDAVAATEADYGTEYLDYIISVKTVKTLQEAIDHINRYNTKHSEAIITSIEENAEEFLRQVDAACVYVNASTRFTDGFEFGFGAEIGISTQMLHARGPMGLKELTSYKYTIKGAGQIRG